MGKVNKLFLGILYLACTWVVLAMTFQVGMLALYVTNPTLEKKISNELSWRIDGSFSNLPENIWYQSPSVAIGMVTNNVKVGALAGNRKLEFGVRNVVEEILQDKNYNIDHSSDSRLDIEIVYLDVLKTQSSFSVMHSNKESVVIRLYGKVIKDGKVIKKALVEESADETSMSTLLIDEGGKFNQQNLSTALKKACNSLVNKLL